MKNVSFAMLGLVSVLALTAISNPIYADDVTGTGTTCSSCGCKPHAEDRENIVPREGIDPEVAPKDQQQGDVKTQY